MSWARPSIFGRRHAAPVVVTVIVGILAAPVLAAQVGGGTVPVLTGRSIVRKLADPAASAQGAVNLLGSALSPDEELDQALMGLASAADGATVAAMRQRALDVLEGNAIAGKAWSGIPLLAWNPAGKVKTVPAGGSVTVTEVRFGDRMISDTSVLKFDNPALPFSVVYRVSELGGTMGGLLTPVPLAASGVAAPAAHQLLGLPRLETGTTEINRSHVLGAAEMTRLAVEDVTVAMPAPNALTAIVDPSMRPGRPSMSLLTPSSPERLTAMSAFGDKATAIGRLADVAPAKQLWSDLNRLGSADIAAAHALGAADRSLLSGIRSHLALPAGVATGAGDVTLALAGNEAFASRDVIPVASAPTTVAFRNLDGVAHRVSAAAFTGGNGGKPYNWGSFNWRWVGSPVTVAPHDSVSVPLALPADTFAVWMGDIDSGDQASVVIPARPGAVVPISTPAKPPAPVPAAPSTPSAPSAPQPPTVGAGGSVEGDSFDAPIDGATLGSESAFTGAIGGQASAVRSFNSFSLESPVSDDPVEINPVAGGGISEVSPTDDPLIKVRPKKSSVLSGSADGVGSAGGYTGLYKLAGLTLFLAFAWGWWAWGGALPARDEADEAEAPSGA